MTLAADYIDRLACPHCGGPVRKTGSWSIPEAEWLFAAQPISVRKPRTERPEYDGQRWTNIPREIEFTERDGTTSSKRQDQWHYLVEFECMGDYFDARREDSCGYFQRLDCVPFHGEPNHSLMDAPGAGSLISAEVKETVLRMRREAVA